MTEIHRPEKRREIDGKKTKQHPVNIVQPFRWHHLPLARRLAGRGVSLDARMRLTQGYGDRRGPRWMALPVSAGSEMPAYVIRREALVQFRLARGQHQAHVAYLAPSLEHGADESLWMTMLDALAQVAGEHGATDVIAEVEEDSPAVAVLRRCGFAAYVRQAIWYRPPSSLPKSSSHLRQARAVDKPGMMALYAALVPGLMQQVEPPPTATDYQYVLDGRGGIDGVIAVCLGRQGALLEVYLHPRAHERAGKLIAGALGCLRPRNHPVYCRVRRYEVWPSKALSALGFERVGEQVVMVRHTAVRWPYRAVSTAPTMEEGHVPLATMVKQTSPAQEGGQRGTV
jgi:hypothetical protein